MDDMHESTDMGFLSILFSVVLALSASGSVSLGVISMPYWVLTAVLGGALGWVTKRVLDYLARKAKARHLLPSILDDGLEDREKSPK